MLWQSCAAPSGRQSGLRQRVSQLSDRLSAALSQVELEEAAAKITDLETQLQSQTEVAEQLSKVWLLLLD